MAKPRADGSKLPSRKISATIIEFGEPLLKQLDTEQPLVLVRATFEIVITVWNAHVMAMPVWNAPQFLADLEALLKTATIAPQMIAAYRDLTARRQQRLADDPRAVGEWSLSIDHAGRVRLRCDARIPPSRTPRRA